MHWNMRRIYDESTLCIEQGTGKIQTLFNVCRERRSLQYRSHITCNTAQAICKQFQTHGFWSDVPLSISHRRAAQYERAVPINLSFPIRIDKRSTVRLKDEGRPAHSRTRAEQIPVKQSGVYPRMASPKTRTTLGSLLDFFRRLKRTFLARGSNRSNGAHGHDLDLPFDRTVSIERLVALYESRLDVITPVYGQRLVLTDKAHFHNPPPHSSFTDPFFSHARKRLSLDLVHHRLEPITQYF